ncbi:MAG: preprotein translocase subunit SecG [Chloroflexi bacterium]|nr:preprotein translocase subunit SecG [Chloroflexota bacterium]MXY00279.1 preprotein translocase subunit SecG [Chloroflexota bacterium]MXY13519.1 preprotein translocase subunit SecG [Chloroflexota bacterium]MYB16600.1 preprotein translocase subunit SecG [Chloroflexota bacterium]MYC48022.1 preprotein translocase subunit SecG [Chloroflexota bacterium]
MPEKSSLGSRERSFPGAPATVCRSSPKPGDSATPPRCTTASAGCAAGRPRIPAHPSNNRGHLLESVLQIIQILLAVSVVGAVLMQNSSTGLGSAFGQSDSFRATRRGLDLVLYRFTVAAAIAFFLVSALVVRLAV